MTAGLAQRHPGPSSQIRVLLACSGLEHARRGFESFARDCFDALRDHPDVTIELVKGSGPPGIRERSIPTLRRDHRLALAAGKAFSVRPFRLEAFAFGFSLQPLLAIRRPDVVFLSEWDTARVLAKTRALTGERFKLVLSNGTLAAEGFEHLDLVQDLTPAAHEYVLARGADPARHRMLPLGFHIGRELELPGPMERHALRERLDLPTDRRILISVAALNRYHKRLDYVIDEVARLPAPRPFLLLVGQQEEETAGLRALAAERLGPRGYSMRTVASEAVPDLLFASDAFVLASVFEGLPRALIEALAHGLPCLVHDYPITKFALGPYGYAADLQGPGGLSSLVAHLREEDFSAAIARERHRYAYEQFSWDQLTPRYVALLREAADRPAQSWRSRALRP